MIRQARPFVLMAVLALLQVSVLDQFAFWGIAHLSVVLWAVVAASLANPPATAVKLGFAGGLFMDLLGPSHLGRQALTLCLVAWFVSLLAPRLLTAGRLVGWLERSTLLVFSTVFVWLVGRIMGLPFPAIDPWLAPGLVLASLLGGLLSSPLRGLGLLLSPAGSADRFVTSLVPKRVKLPAKKTSEDLAGAEDEPAVVLSLDQPAISPARPS